MADFTVRFFLSNIGIAIIAAILLAARRLLRKCLTSRAQYRLWFLLLGAMAVPFLPLKPYQAGRIFSWFSAWGSPSVSSDNVGSHGAAVSGASGTLGWMSDFAVSVSVKTPSAVGVILSLFWAAGILAMAALLAESALRLRAVRKSAMPLSSCDVRRVYRSCLEEMKISRKIPLYGTAYLKSPVLAGLFRPCIYLPLHLVSDFHAAKMRYMLLHEDKQNEEMRYMLLHELQHYKHKDGFVNLGMALAQILYWFNPLVWYALREMRDDRELACDASVLQMLQPDDYEKYGNTLINFAEKISLTPFPFTAGLGGNMGQMKKRILNIACYRPASFRRKMGNMAAFLCTALLLSAFLPALSTGAAPDRYAFPESENRIAYIDYSAFFGGMEGCFVLYDDAGDSWLIYNREDAFTRIPPASTYKIYAALHALENGAITPEHNRLSWNGMRYPYEAWNKDQTLKSAMENSVTWYFQDLDNQMGLKSVDRFIREIGYGNQLVGGNVSSYWLGSPLKISPVEQVELLREFHEGKLPFSPENRSAVEDSIRLSSTEKGTLYGKTGTQAIDGKNTSGWFIGYLESGRGTYYFAANIRNEDNATGSAAAELTFEILEGMGIGQFHLSLRPCPGFPHFPAFVRNSFQQGQRVYLP